MLSNRGSKPLDLRRSAGNRKVPPDTELKRLYLDLKLNTKQIGEKFNTSAKTVLKHLTRLGINRNRGKSNIGMKYKVKPKSLEKRIKSEIATWAERSHSHKHAIYCQKCGLETINFNLVTKELEGTLTTISLKYCDKCFKS